MKKNKVSRMLALALAGVMAVSSLTAAPKASAASGKYVKSLKVKKKVTVSVGKKATVKPVVNVAKKASKALKVTVKDKKVAKVTYSVKKQVITITGKKAGTTKVTVTTKGLNKKGKKISAGITVNVKGAAGKDSETASPAVSTAPSTQVPVQTSAPSASADVITLPAPTPTATHYAAVNVKGNVVDVYARNGIHSVSDLEKDSSNASRARTSKAVKGIQKDVKLWKGIVSESEDEPGDAKPEVSTEPGVSDEELKSSTLTDATVYLVPDTDNSQPDVDKLPEGTLETATNENGDYGFDQVPCGDYCLLIQKENYKPATQFFTLSDLQPDYQMEAMYVLDETIAAAVKGKISGTIVDATNKEPIEGLTVELRSNKGNTFGTADMTTKTDESGRYTFGDEDELLGADQYTVYVKDERVLTSDDDRHYISNIMNTCVFTNGTTSLDIAMTKPVSASGGGLRFVLQWGSEDEDGVPADLDSHFYGPRAMPADNDYESDMFHIYFTSKNYGIEDTKYANLDVDDTWYEGPETVTLEKESDGVYYYYVYNYSQTSSLATSQATVKVYAGDSSEPLTVYNVPSGNNDALWWRVCSYDSRTHELNSYNVLEEENTLDEVTDGDYFLGYETGLESVTAANEDDISYCYVNNNEDTDDEQKASISVYGSVPWSTMKDEIQFEVRPGYTVSFEEAGDLDSPDYRGNVVLNDGNNSYKYRLYYYYSFDDTEYDIYAEGDGLARYSYDSYYGELSVYLATDTVEDVEEIIRNLKVTSGDDRFVCGDVAYEYDEDDEDWYCSFPLLDAGNGEYLKTVYILVFTGRYVADVTYDGEKVVFYEGSTYIEVYGDSSDSADYDYQCADGFTADVFYDEDYEQEYLQVKNSAGEIVSKKYLYLEEDY